jgi:hypothetical protein
MSSFSKLEESVGRVAIHLLVSLGRSVKFVAVLTSRYHDAALNFATSVLAFIGECCRVRKACWLGRGIHSIGRPMKLNDEKPVLVKNSTTP